MSVAATHLEHKMSCLFPASFSFSCKNNRRRHKVRNEREKICCLLFPSSLQDSHSKTLWLGPYVLCEGGRWGGGGGRGKKETVRKIPVKHKFQRLVLSHPVIIQTWEDIFFWFLIDRVWRRRREKVWEVEREREIGRVRKRDPVGRPHLSRLLVSLTCLSLHFLPYFFSFKIQTIFIFSISPRCPSAVCGDWCHRLSSSPPRGSCLQDRPRCCSQFSPSVLQTTLRDLTPAPDWCLSSW